MSKYKKQIILFLLIIELCSVYLTFSSFNNNDITKIKEENKVNKEIFSMYVINETTGKYEEVTDSEYWPSGNYKLNTTKSSCVDTKGKSVSSDVLNYNGGKLTISSNQTLFCYLYFDIKPDDITIKLSTDGVSGELPTTFGYKTNLTCNNSTYSWNPIYQRIEFSGVSSDEVKCNLDYTKDTETHTTLISEVESKAQTHENGHRYSGKQPDNWVWFDGEKWRIIGSIPTTLADETEANLVKIIRNKENYPLYFYEEDLEFEETRLDSSLYMLWDEDFNYYRIMVEEVYWNSGTINLTSSITSTYEAETTEKTSMTGFEGMMSASDYGYATSGITYNSVKLSELSNYEQNNWLYKHDNEFLFSFYSIESDGSFDSADGVHSITRSVIYLNPSVYIISGDGTEANPYVIGI